MAGERADRRWPPGGSGCREGAGGGGGSDDPGWVAGWETGIEHAARERALASGAVASSSRGALLGGLGETEECILLFWWTWATPGLVGSTGA